MSLLRRTVLPQNTTPLGPISSSPTVIPDRAGDNDGVNDGATVAVVDGVAGLAFDGVDNVVTAPDAAIYDFDETDSCVFETRARILEGGSGGSHVSLFGKLNRDGVHTGYSFVQRPNDRLAATCGSHADNGNGNRYVNSASNLSDYEFGEWTMLSAYVDRSAQFLRFWIDGNLIGTADITTIGSLANSEPVRWGRDSTALHWAGHQTESRIWNANGMSAQDVEDMIQANLHRRLSGNEAGLVGYWPVAGRHQLVQPLLARVA